MAVEFPESPYCQVRWRLASINGGNTEDNSVVLLPKVGQKVTLCNPTFGDTI